MKNESYEINRLDREIEKDRLSTESKKKQFIREIKSGLGEKIIKPVEPPKESGFKKFLKKLRRVFG